MVRIITQSFKNRNYGLQNKSTYNLKEEVMNRGAFLTRNAKFLAWVIFFIFFIENGTLGLIPRQFYYLYRNVRISDILMYAVIIYSLFNIKEYWDLYSSRAFIIVKIFLTYIILQFIGSAIVYDYNNVIEFFFRLKGVWFSFLVFPYMLLLKRKALPYLIKIVFPFAVISNILYIISSVTGVAMMPDISVVKLKLPGGIEVSRVFGGTFFGEIFFLGFIYLWITKKFKLYQLFFVILFIVPHILAFGRAAWIFFIFTIVLIYFWNLLKNKNIKVLIRQVALTIILVASLIYGLREFVPQSDTLAEALGSRLEQGQENVEYKEGTYGTRLLNIAALTNLWLDNNILVGIGMHPMWVIKPETAEESIYAWGFSDIRWAGVLAAYGLIGFILAIVFQIYYMVISLKILKHNVKNDLLIFFILVFLSQLLFDSFINYTYYLTTIGLLGISSSTCLFLTALIYKHEHPEK
jgi:hypothetical protein